MNGQVARVNIQAAPFYIADWLVDPVSHTIARGAHTEKLEPKVMSVLVLLAKKAGTVVTREELESNLWSGTVVGYDALCNAIIKIRKAFGDQARHPSIIETISKSGYRLIAAVSNTSIDESGRSEATTSDLVESSCYGPRLILPKTPSIAVLAFDNNCDEPEQEYFCDGLAEDIITDLSRNSGLFVIARNSTFAYKGRQVNLQAVSRELGVRFILEGSVRKVGQYVRISAQLIDGTTGGHVWAERYDREVTELFDLQDEVRRTIVGALEHILSLALSSRLDSRGTGNEEAYHYFVRGREQDRQDTKVSNGKARELFESAIDRDPEFSNAYSYLSRNHAVCFINRWSELSENLLQSALELGRKAIDLDYSNPHAHFATGASLLWMRQHDLALREAETAIEFDTNFAEGHALLGMILMYMGKPSKAVKSLQTAMRLDPYFRDAYLHIVAQAYFHAGQYQSAVDALKNRLIRKPDSDTSRVLLASSYGQLGELEKSRSAWAEALQVNPDYSVQNKRKILPYKNPVDFECFVAGLRNAGLPCNPE